MKAVVILAAVAAASTVAHADVITYQPTRDTFMRGVTDTELHGSDPNGRASKAFLDFYLTDFDRAAIRASIESQLGHALTAADMANVELTWSLFSNDFQGYQPDALSRPAVFQGTQDWVEGTNTTAGATKGYAVWDPATQTGQRWRDTAGNEVGSFLALPEVQNANFEPWGGAPYTYRAWTLDDNVAYAYLTDPLSLGLYLNASDQGPGGDLADYNNTEVFSRETTNTSRLPFLQVTVVPEPRAAAAAAASVAASLALLRRARNGSCRWRRGPQD